MLTGTKDGNPTAEAQRTMAVMGMWGEDIIRFRQQKHKEKLYIEEAQYLLPLLHA